MLRRKAVSVLSVLLNHYPKRIYCIIIMRMLQAPFQALCLVVCVKNHIFQEIFHFCNKRGKILLLKQSVY